MCAVKKPRWAFICFFAPIIIAFVTVVMMLLWNWLIPAIFNGPAITFWQALGLLLLSKILFTGFGRNFDHHHPHHPPWHEKFRQKMREKIPPPGPDATEK